MNSQKNIYKNIPWLGKMFKGDSKFLKSRSQNDFFVNEKREREHALYLHCILEIGHRSDENTMQV